MRPFTEEEDARIQELRRSGLNYVEVAQRVGRAPVTVQGRLCSLARREEREAD